MADPIALVGAACRFPQAPDLETFWSLVADAGDAITEACATRWPAPRRPPIARAGFLSSIADFDALAFAMSPVQAAETDPQQRLMLEVAVEALENARLGPADLEAQTVGVYIGMGSSEYDARFVDPHEGPRGLWSGLGNDPSFAPGRIASLLGLRGPAVALNTACSSSLVAIDAALRDLRRGRCTLAVVGAVNLLVVPENSTRLHRMGVLALDGRSKAFDRSADGYGRAEGAGAIVLATPEVAETLGLVVQARVHGAAVNQDGGATGLTAPSADAQVEVIAAALEDAGLAPDAIDAIEAHGTGTPTGDPVEIEALGRAFAGRERPLPIGSVKSNIGHLEVAAGLAGVLKALGMLQQTRPLPHRVHDAPITLPRPLCLAGSGLATSTCQGIEHIGVSAFGLSGTNAHVVLGRGTPEPVLTPRTSDGRPHVLVASASGPQALRALAAKLAQTIAANPDAFAEIAASTWRTRRSLPQRLAVVSSDPVAASEVLQRYAATGAVGSGEGTFVAAGTAGSQPPLALFVGELDGDWSGLLERLGHFEAVRSVVDAAPRDAATPVVAAVALARLWQACGLDFARVDGVGEGARAAEIVNGERALGDGHPIAPLGEPPSTAHDDELVYVIGKGPHLAVVAGSDLTEARLLHVVAQSWCRGRDIAWDAVAPANLRRMALPPTSWQRLRAWVDEPTGRTPRRTTRTERRSTPPTPPPAVRAEPTSVAEPTPFARAWRPLPDLPPADGSRPWLIVADQQGVASALARTLTPAPRVVYLAPSQEDPEATWIDVEDPDAVATFLTGLPDIAGVLFLAGLDQRPAFDGDGAPVPEAADDVVRGVWLAAAWARAVLEHVPRRGYGARRFWMASRGAVACPDLADRAVDPTQAALWGFGATLALEHPELGVGCVDLDPGGDVGGLAALLGVRVHEDQLALRGDVAYGARLSPTTAPEPSPRWDGPVLVTGGLGALGLHLAEALAARGTPEVWLVGRRPPSADARTRITRLEARGVKVEVHALDITDAESVEAWASHRTTAPVGWIHAAGVLDDGIVMHLSADRYLTAMRPKVHGTLVLARALDRSALQHVVFCSSVAGWLGAMGQANYAAANAWLDGFASALRARGLPATSVALGPIAGDGMAHDHVDRLARLGIQALDPTAVARTLLDATVTAGPLAIVDLDLDRIAHHDRLRPLLREVGSPPTPSAPAAPNRSRDDLAAWLTSRVSRDLGLAPGALDPRRPLPWHGFDSLMAIELKRSLDAELGTSLPSAPFLSGPSLEGLVDALAPRIITGATRTPTISPSFSNVPSLRAEGARSGAAGLVPVRLDAPVATSELRRLNPAALPLAAKFGLGALLALALSLAWLVG